MDEFKNLMPVREFCRQNSWPTLSQINYWVYTENPIAEKCIKRISGRLLIDVKEFSEIVRNATLKVSVDSQNAQDEKNNVRTPPHSNEGAESNNKIKKVM